MTGRAAVVLGVVCAAFAGSTDVATAGPALRVVASLHPAAALYGDPVTAVVEVGYDPHAAIKAPIAV